MEFQGRDIELVAVKIHLAITEREREPYCPGLNKEKCLFVIGKHTISFTHTHIHTECWFAQDEGEQNMLSQNMSL